MKVCDLTQFYSPRSGGVRRYVDEKAAWIREQTGHEHLLIIPGDRDEIRTTDRTTTYLIKSPLVSKTSQYRALLRLGRVNEILAKEKPDLIESADPYQLAWKAIYSGRSLGSPVVGFYHSHFAEAYLRGPAKTLGKAAEKFVMAGAQRYVRHLYNRFQCTLAPSPAIAETLRDWRVANVKAVDLGVNIRTFSPCDYDPAAKAKFNIPPETFLLLYVGRLASEKNTRTLFAAFEILTRDHPNRFHLLTVGDGPQRDALQDLQKKTGSSTWIPFCENPAELAEIYRAADLFVHPGVQETFGLVALEAQACGTPVVGIRGTPLDRIIQTDQQWWANEDSPTALANAILETACLPDLRSSGRVASERVASLFSWDKIFERLFSIYDEVMIDFSRTL